MNRQHPNTPLKCEEPLIPSALWSIVDVFGRSGGEWRNIWPKRVLGIAVWCLCAGLLTGVIVLGH